METSTKWAIGILAVAAATTGIIIYRTRKQREDLEEPSLDKQLTDKEVFAKLSEGERGSQQKKKTLNITSDSIQLGSAGRPVALIQAWLNYKHKANLDVDGKFGEATRAAIRKAFYITMPCGYGGVGNPKCPLKCSDTLVVEAKMGLGHDKKFQEYFIKAVKPVWREYEPYSWCGLNFGK